MSKCQLVDNNNNNNKVEADEIETLHIDDDNKTLPVLMTKPKSTYMIYIIVMLFAPKRYFHQGY